jgi:hypothetical protein
MIQICDWIKKLIPAFRVFLLWWSKMIRRNEPKAIISQAVRNAMEFCREHIPIRLACTKIKLIQCRFIFEDGEWYVFMYCIPKSAPVRNVKLIIRINKPESASILIGMGPVTSEPDRTTSMAFPVNALTAKILLTVANATVADMVTNHFRIAVTNGVSTTATRIINIKAMIGAIISVEKRFLKIPGR